MSDPDQALLLEACGLHKSYALGHRRLEVLQGVDIQINRGDFVVVRGASGAGKSTLLHLLAGLDAPDEGSIRFTGIDLGRMSAVERTRFRNRRVGFVFQAYHLLPELSALENVGLPARMAREPSGRVTNRARELLGRVGLSDRMSHRPYELSGGEQQRVAIARALINGPDLVLADEPTGNLDSHTGAEIIELLLALRLEQGTALIIATHDERVAVQAPRKVVLVDGRVESDPTTESRPPG